MKFTVRTQEGELTYGSFGEVHQAWLMGLVGPDDELLEDGHTKWRKASTYPTLMQARRTSEQAWGGSWFLWTVIGILLASSALWLIKAELYFYGGVLGLATAMVMFHVTTQAHKRTRPPG